MENIVSDVFDSVKFAETEKPADEIRLNRVYAAAALYEALLFHENGLILTAPQFFDGICGGDAAWREKIFKLIEKGCVKIGLYNVHGAENPITNMRDYVSRFVAQEKKPYAARTVFRYSSRPEIAKRILSDAYIRELDGKVWNHILHGADRPPLAADPVGMEYRELIEFFRAFFALEAKCNDIYSLQSSPFISYKDFFRRVFSQSGVDVFALLDLQATPQREEIINRLIDVRSKVDAFLLEEKSHALPAPVVGTIKTVSDLLYNKYALINFPNVEIHVPWIEDPEKRELLQRVAAFSLKERETRFRYENTEVIRAEHTLGALSFDDVLGMREEIARLKEKDRLPSWKDALEKYRSNLQTVRSLVYSDGDDRDLVVSDGAEAGAYLYSSRDLQKAMSAAEKEAFIHNVENLERADSYTS